MLHGPGLSVDAGLVWLRALGNSNALGRAGLAERSSRVRLTTSQLTNSVLQTVQLSTLQLSGLHFGLHSLWVTRNSTELPVSRPDPR